MPRGRPRIHPPKIPHGEDQSVTIRNQENQIKLLIDRVTNLTNELNAAKKDNDSLEETYLGISEMNGNLAKTLSEVQQSYTRLLGYQDCAREIFAMLLKGEAT